MLLPTLVLISVQGEHHRLEEGIDLGERDEATEGGDVSWLRLKKEEEVGVLLELAFVGVLALCGVDFFEMSFDFALLAAECLLS